MAWLLTEVFMDNLSKYIYKNYAHLMTTSENLTWRYFLFLEKNKVDAAKNIETGNFGEEVSNFIKKGEAEFYIYVRDRILNQHQEEIFLNYCPKCGFLTRTPRAKQCLQCKYDWH